MSDNVVRPPAWRKAKKLPVQKLPVPMRAPKTMAHEPEAEAKLLPVIEGKHVCWFLIGRGRIGKTTFARWLCESMDARGGEAIVAAADPGGRSLRLYRKDVTEPDTTDAVEVAEWLKDLLGHIMISEQNAIVDLGGGSTALADTLDALPELAGLLVDHGVYPIACHVVGPDPDDLVPLAQMEAQPFAPAHTVIILNEAHGLPTRFDQVLEHPTLLAAKARGAAVIWMPRLNPGALAECNAYSWHFADAVAKAPSPMTQQAIASWLRAMHAAFSPIASWIPG